MSFRENVLDFLSSYYDTLCKKSLIIRNYYKYGDGYLDCVSDFLNLIKKDFPDFKE